jgi:hypothetical protein
VTSQEGLKSMKLVSYDFHSLFGAVASQGAGQSEIQSAGQSDNQPFKQSDS